VVDRTSVDQRCGRSVARGLVPLCDPLCLTLIVTIDAQPTFPPRHALPKVMKLATVPCTTPVAVWIGAFLIPYLIAYLVHFPHTRALRLGLFPLGLFCGGWLIATINIADEPRKASCDFGKEELTS
jgi:hypothetical protein